ncbi:uncharacterized protein TNCV_698981 [Trichonephila clavipes]|nr:uncharacterized protein TNCV_698981 [Trichonephila clavipes]
MAEDDDWLSNSLRTGEAHFTPEGLSTPTTAEFGLLKILELSWKTPLHDEKVTVWVGFTTSTVISRAFFFEEMRDSGFVTATVTGPQRSQSVRLLALGLPEVAGIDRPTSLGMLKDNIRLQCLTVTPDMLYSAVHNIMPRLQLLLRNDGEHIEHFL